MLRIALAALSALLLLAPVATAAPKPKPKPPACKAGEVQIRVLAKQAKTAKKTKKAKKPRTRITCRALVRPGATAPPPAEALRRVAVTPKQLQAAMPKRLRKRFPLAAVQRLDRAFARRAATARAASAARPRAGAASAGCGGEPTPGPTRTQDVEAGKLTSSGGSWGQPGGSTWGTRTVLRGEIDRDGATGSRTQTITQCTHFEQCPSAEGIVKGTWEHTLQEVLTVTKGGVTATIRVTMRSTAKLTGHVGADARATTFDWTAEGIGTSRGQVRVGGGPTTRKVNETVRVTTTQTGADPRKGGKGPAEPAYKAWGVGGSVLDGTAAASLSTAGVLLLQQIGPLPADASNALLGAEKVWYDDAACLDVAFDPQPAQASANAKVPVSVKVKAEDGADVAASFDARPVSGAVAPASGTTAATVTWTAPDKVDERPFPTFEVVALSKRGRALGTHTAKGPEKAKWWRVTYEGAGEYGRHEPRVNPYPHLWSDIHFRYRMVSMPVQIPTTDPGRRLLTGSETADLSGDANAKRVDGGGTRTCSSPLNGEHNIGRVAVEGGDGGFYLDVVPFFVLTPVDRSCIFDDMLHWMGPTVEPGIQATIHVTPADLAAGDRIERVVREPGATADCSDGRNAGNHDVPCSEQVKWEGRIVLERVPAPAGA